jgi:hypothetical protein
VFCVDSRSNIIKNLAAAFLASGAIMIPLPAEADVDFLVPGVSLESVEFTAGSSVSYMIISVAHGIRDTSLVTLSVTGTEAGKVDLEIISSGWPPVEDETVTVRLTLCAEARRLDTPDDLYACIGKVLVKNGREGFREPSPEELEEFNIERVFLRRNEGLQRKILEPEQVETPAGSFACEVNEYFDSDRREVEMGGITAQRIEEERSVLKTSPAVPLWGLVSSRVERKSVTGYPGGSQPRLSRPRINVTESILVSYSAPRITKGE